MRLNFEEGEYLEGYRSLFTSTGKINLDEGIYLNRKEYSHGNSLFGFDLSPALCSGQHQEPVKEGSLRISLEFTKALPNTITVLYACMLNSLTLLKSEESLKTIDWDGYFTIKMCFGG